nr:hypothetical protein [Dawidia cretensis]
MAKQTGILKFTGKLGNRVYYYHRYFGYLVRKITSVDAHRIRTDPAFARVHKHNVEFGVCAHAVKLLRAAFHPLFATLADSRMTSRLTSAMLAVLHADNQHLLGRRVLTVENMSSLKGFEFNNNTRLHSVLMGTHTAAIDRKTKTCTVSLQACPTGQFVKAPKAATHFQLTMGIAAINHRSGQYVLHTQTGPPQAVSTRSHNSITLINPLPPVEGGTVLMTLGVEFFQYVNGILCPLRDRQQQALAIVLVATGVRRPARHYRVHAPNRSRRPMSRRLRHNARKVVSDQPTAAFLHHYDIRGKPQHSAFEVDFGRGQIAKHFHRREVDGTG